MLAPFKSNHWNDDNGNPAGGQSDATGILIHWQNGPLGRGDERIEPNGAFVETVIAIAADRLRYYQGTRFSCEENARAIERLEEALYWLNHRTAAREAREVEGTHTV